MIEIITDYATEAEAANMIVSKIINGITPDTITIAILFFMVIGINVIFDYWLRRERNDKR